MPRGDHRQALQTTVLDGELVGTEIRYELDQLVAAPIEMLDHLGAGVNVGDARVLSVQVVDVFGSDLQVLAVEHGLEPPTDVVVGVSYVVDDDTDGPGVLFSERARAPLLLGAFG